MSIQSLTCIAAVVCLVTTAGCPPIADPPETAPETGAPSAAAPTDSRGAADKPSSEGESKEEDSRDPDSAGGQTEASTSGGGAGGSNGSDGDGTSSGEESGHPSVGGDSADGGSTEGAGSSKFADAAAAERHGRQSLKKAKGTADPAKAAAIALEGWREVRRFPADAGCRDLANELLAEVKQHEAELTPASRGRAIDGLPLKIR